MQSLHDQRTREGFGLATLPAVYSRAVLARVLAERGIFDEGDTHGQEAIRIAEALDHPFSVVVACLDLAYLKSVRGELSQAARLLERAVAQCREWNITTHTPIAMASLGHAHAWSMTPICRSSSDALHEQCTATSAHETKTTRNRRDG